MKEKYRNPNKERENQEEVGKKKRKNGISKKR